MSSSRCGVLRWRLVRHRVRMGRTAGCREQQHQEVCHRGIAPKGARKKEHGKRPLWGNSPTRVEKKSGGKRLYVDDCVGLCNKVGRLRNEELPLIPALAQYLALHAHELHFALGIKRSV